MNDMKLLDNLIIINDDLKKLLKKIIGKRDLSYNEILYLSELIKLYYIYHFEEEE